MVKAVTILFTAIIPLHACSPFGGASAFTCDEDTDCRDNGQGDGRCEMSTGFCAFPDDNCGPLGRYGSLAGSLSNQCVEGGGADAGVDSEMPDGSQEDVCFGSTTGLVKPCFAFDQVPSDAVVITANIDTDNAACSTVKNAAGVCVIAGASISIPANTTIAVSGGKPLLLLSTSTIQIDGTLDGASHRVGATQGPAANNPACDNGTAATNSGGQGGGGAGGSFGAKGGDGGGPGTTKGLAGAAQVPDALRGGCRGQDGKEGGGAANTRGIGGNGGGALYLIADTSITIGATGVIDASGAGGSTGLSTFASAGGGGGGSGGMIGIDAPTITNTGSVFANGGGGAEGTGVSQNGNEGSDPTGIGPAAPGAGKSGSGGDGGEGGAQSNGRTGANGGTGVSTGTVSGGGGGGGTGVIRVFGGTLGGNRSPDPS